jgi:uridylate kinase
MKYKRILLKLSGEALMGEQQYGIDTERISGYAHEIQTVVKEKVQVAIVIGGGNIFRGLKGMSEGTDRVTGDYMGMLATVINSMALQAALDKLEIKTLLLSGLQIDPICKRMDSKKAIGDLGKGKVVIIAGGTGNPYFTTDTAAALRALEIKADVILKGTRVDGVYNADPEKDKTAVKFDELSFDEAYEKGLQIMDLTAFTLCRENNMPIIVFNMNKQGNLKSVCLGEKTGTLIKSE